MRVIGLMGDSVHDTEEAVVMFGVQVETHGEEVCKVVCWGSDLVNDGERKHLGQFPGFALCQCVYPQDSSDRVVCSVPHPRVHLLGGVKTRLEDGDNCIVWWFNVDSFFKPPNCASKSDSGVECFRVGDVSEDPRYAPDVVRVVYQKCGEIFRRQPWVHFLRNRRILGGW